MSTVSTIFCWLGGVILPTIPDMAIRSLQDQKLDFWTRTTIRDLAQDLILGKLDGLSYCKRVIEMTGAGITAEDLEEIILRSAPLHTPTLEVVAELPATCQIWLISDYPPNWFSQISARFSAYPFVQEHRLIFTADCQLPRLVPDVFYTLVQKAGQAMDACMMVDGDSARAVEAVKHGLSSEIFINAPRLRLELTLRKMLPRSN